MDEDGRRWEDLEVDCLLCIFQRLSLEDLTLGVPFVCNSWFKASLHPFCWRILDFQTSAFRESGKLAKRFNSTTFSFTSFFRYAVSRSCKLAVELRFPNIQDVFSVQDLAFASNECPRLKVIALPNLAPHDEFHIPQLIGKWKDLERVEMDLKPSCFPELIKEIGINCAKFVDLTMCGSIQRGDVLAIVNFTPKIMCLDLSRSYLPKDELLVILDGCKEMEKLSVNSCIGFEADTQVIEMASNIRIFEHERSKLWDCYVHKRRL